MFDHVNWRLWGRAGDGEMGGWGEGLKAFTEATQSQI